MPARAHPLTLRYAAGRPGQRVALARTLADRPGFREGDQGAVLWVDTTIHIEMDAGNRLDVGDPDAIRRLGLHSSSNGSH